MILWNSITQRVTSKNEALTLTDTVVRKSPHLANNSFEISEETNYLKTHICIHLLTDIGLLFRERLILPVFLFQFTFCLCYFNKNK